MIDLVGQETQTTTPQHRITNNRYFTIYDQHMREKKYDSQMCDLQERRTYYGIPIHRS